MGVEAQQRLEVSQFGTMRELRDFLCSYRVIVLIGRIPVESGARQRACELRSNLIQSINQAATRGGFVYPEDMKKPLTEEQIKTAVEFLELFATASLDEANPAESFKTYFYVDYLEELMRISAADPVKILKFSERYADKIEKGQIKLPKSGDLLDLLVHVDRSIDEINEELFGPRDIEKLLKLSKSVVEILRYGGWIIHEQIFRTKLGVAVATAIAAS